MGGHVLSFILWEQKNLHNKMISMFILARRGAYRIQSIVYSSDSFPGKEWTLGWATPKSCEMCLFFFLPPLNLAVSHFLEVPVPLTHSGSPSQSPFVNRTMFYNSPALWDDHINNAEEPYLSGAMRLFLRFGPTVMVIVWQTIYSSNNDHRLQRFSD